MANSFGTDHNCKFANDIVFILWIMNDAKSAPFAHIPYVKNPCIPPKISKSHSFGKLREIRLPFFDLNNEKWNPLNSQRITRKSLNSPPPVMNHAKFARFLKKSHQSLLPNCTPTFCSKFREIRSLRKDSERFTRN